MSRSITITIDGREVRGREGETILHVANRKGISIATLCHLDGLSEVGSCRLCFVEVALEMDSPFSLRAACTTPIREGMQVSTRSAAVERYRQMMIALLFGSGSHVCSVCVSNGHCELQNLARSNRLDHMLVESRRAGLPVDASHERFIFDPNRCCLCTRCVRVCEEVEGAR